MGKKGFFDPTKCIFPGNVNIYVDMRYSELGGAFKNVDVLWWSMLV